MNSFIGNRHVKKIMAALVMTAALTTLAAENRNLFHEDFETQGPGEFPKNWKYLWGKADADYISISNEKSFSSSRSLLVERVDGQVPWGMAMVLPEIEQGLVTIEYKFMFEGPGNQASFSFELRDKAQANARLISWLVSNSRLRMSSNVHTPKKPRTSVGDVFAGKWYIFRLKVPVNLKNNTMAVMELEDTVTGEKKSGEVDFLNPPKKFGLLVLNMPAKNNNFRGFIDDLNISVSNP